MTFEHYDYENKIPLDKLYDELDLIYEFYENKKFDRKNIDKKSYDVFTYIGFKKIDDRLYKINYRTFNKWMNKGL